MVTGPLPELPLQFLAFLLFSVMQASLGKVKKVEKVETSHQRVGHSPLSVLYFLEYPLEYSLEAYLSCCCKFVCCCSFTISLLVPSSRGLVTRLVRTKSFSRGSCFTLLSSLVWSTLSPGEETRSVGQDQLTVTNLTSTTSTMTNLTSQHD